MSVPARHAVGLDVGSMHTRCVVCLLEDGRMRYLGHSDMPSAGWSKGRISDQVAATESIRAAITEAERRAQVSVEGAVVGVGGASVEGMNGRGLYEFGRPREIDPGDLNYAVELASKVRLQEDRIVLQVAPQDFTLDGRAGYPKSSRSHVRSARSERPHHHGLQPRASGPDQRRSSGVARRGRNHLRTRRLPRYAAVYAGRARLAGSRSSISARIRQTWSSTTATRCLRASSIPVSSADHLHPRRGVRFDSFVRRRRTV